MAKVAIGEMHNKEKCALSTQCTIGNPQKHMNATKSNQHRNVSIPETHTVLTLMRILLQGFLFGCCL